MVAASERKDLYIQKADRGNTEVITNRESYLKGMKSLLSDNSKFIQLNILIKVSG